MNGDKQFEIGVVADFLGANWAMFCAFADAEHEINKAQYEDTAAHLDKLAGRS